jgi:transketolase
MASGSEVSLALQAQQLLHDVDDICARVVSMPSHELFLAQDAGYRASVLPPELPRVAIEAAHSMSWDRFLGDRGRMIGIDRFGASAPYQRIYQEFGLTVDRIVAIARELVRAS